MNSHVLDVGVRSDGRRLGGRVAIITGAASGLGRATALRFAAEGATVVCGDLQAVAVPNSIDSDAPTDEVIRAAGGKAMFVEWDVTDAAAAANAIATTLERYARLDIVVANAGVALLGPSLPDEDEEAWHRHLAVNLTGSWNTVRLGLKALIDQGDGGRIITMSSIAGMIALPGAPSGYGVTKAGIVQLTRQAAIEGAPHGITANAICGGWVRTAISRAAWDTPDGLDQLSAMHPLGRLGEASDISAAAAFLSSDDASWITGTALVVDGGITLV
jgi:NAD(P)-dependent dehydrogenase (short-subunit alcohol dehydrogenase family)